ncbi:hypothetical protein D3C81_1621240 [compost metagenome]
MLPKRAERSATGPSVLITSMAAPCETTMATLSRPASRANGVSRPKNVPVYQMRWVSSKWNGTPNSTLPTATPMISAGMKPPTNSAQSQLLRQRGVGILLRYLKPTGRRISANRMTNIAR